MTPDQISADKIKAMRAAFEEAVNSIRSASTLKAVQDAIAAGDIDRLIRILGLDETTFAPLTEALRDSYMTGGQFAADILTPIPTVDGPVVFRFDMTATSAAQWIASESSRLIVEILEDQRDMVRSVIAAGTQAGIGPRQQALDLIGRVGADGVRRGGFIGLTNQQAQWVKNARRDLELLTATPDEIAEWFNSRGLVQPENYNPARSYMGRALRDRRFDATFRRLFKEGKTPTAAQIDAAITAMQSRAQKYRGDTIARNEAIRGLRAGQAEGMAQAISKGDIDPQDVSKDWDSTGDGRTRDTHLMMEGQRKRLNEPFEFPLGGQAMYPGDDSLNAPASELIQCRCRVIYRVDFIGRAIRMEGFR